MYIYTNIYINIYIHIYIFTYIYVSTKEASAHSSVGVARHRAIESSTLTAPQTCSTK